MNDLMDDGSMPADFKGLEPLKDAPIAPAHGIAALALNMAMKWHDMSLVKDGVLYQQYKMEGKNIQTIGLDDVFETAMKMEAYLLGSSARIAKIVVDAIDFKVEDEPEEISGEEMDEIERAALSGTPVGTGSKT